MMLSVTVARSVEEIERFRPFYEQEQWHPEADIDCYLTSLQADDQSARPYVIMICADDRPALLAAGRLEDTLLRWRVGYKTIGRGRARVLRILYGGVIGTMTEESARRLCRELLRELDGGGADAVVFSYPRMDSPLFRVATTEPAPLRRDHGVSANPHWRLVFPGTFEDYVKSRSENTRSYIRRYTNRFRKKCAGRQGIRCVSAPADLDSVLSDVESIACKTYHRGLGAGFQHTPMTRARWALALARGWLRVYVLYLDERPLAFWSGYLYREIFYIEHTGYDPQHADDRPGMILLLHIIEDLCGSGAARAIDFGLGDADYKRRLGTECWNEGEVYLYAPTARGFYLSAMRAFSSVAHHRTKYLLDRLGVGNWLKTRWRKALSHGDHRS